jgi:hypothetical protein
MVSMDGETIIPWELRAIGAEAVGLLVGISPRTVLETVAWKADFPMRLTVRPATWSPARCWPGAMLTESVRKLGRVSAGDDGRVQLISGDAID